MKLNDFFKIGDTIRAIRQKKGMSQKEMAELLGIAHTTYSNYENNNRMPNIDILEKISDVLNVNINDFFIPDSNNDIYFEFLDLFIDWAHSRGYKYTDDCFNETLIIENGGQSAYISDNENLYRFSPQELERARRLLYELFDLLLVSKKISSEEQERDNTIKK